MPDFSALYQKPAGLAKRPPVLPADDYSGIITGAHSDGEINNEKKTPFIQWPVKLLDWGPSVPDEWQVYDANSNSMVTVQRADVDLSARQYNGRFFTTDDSLIMLDEFLRSCGIDLEGRTYAEVLPEVVGKRVTVKVTQYTPRGSTEVRNQVDRMVGEGA